jgi:uncharacterized membrane protein
MAVRPHEFHPAVVHFPIAILPLAIATDMLGRATGRRSLREAGRHLMPLAAVTAAASVLTGVIAQTRVEAPGRAGDALRAHRAANFAVAGLTAALAAWRWRRKSPTPVYLALGLAGVGLLGYTARLGTRMVYRYGVGVDAAGGLRAADGAPRGPSRAAAAVRTAAGDMLRGLPHAIARASYRGRSTSPARTADVATRRLSEGPALDRGRVSVRAGARDQGSGVRTQPPTTSRS